MSSGALLTLVALAQTLTPFGVHEFAYEAVLREIGGIAPLASMSSVISHASVASSACLLTLRDFQNPGSGWPLGQELVVAHVHAGHPRRPFRFDPGLFPEAKAGAFAKSIAANFPLVRLSDTARDEQEYAGLAGDAHFVKAEQEGSVSRWLGGGYVCRSLCLFSGRPADQGPARASSLRACPPDLASCCPCPRLPRPRPLLPSPHLDAQRPSSPTGTTWAGRPLSGTSA